MTTSEITADNVQLYRLHGEKICIRIRLPDGRTVGAIMHPAEAVALGHQFQTIAEATPQPWP